MGADQHGREHVGEILARRAPEIERRWLAEVSTEREASGVDLTALRNAMPDYLRSLSALLRDPRPGQSQSSWKDIAREHGAMRVQLGFDIEQLIREFAVLRRVVFDVLRNEGVRSDSAEADEILNFIEEGMAESARAYAASRSYAQRRQETEHLAFLSHELRNPLSTAMLAMGKLKRSAGGLDPNCKAATDILERNLRRMDGLIAGVLDVARAESGKLPVRPVRATLIDVVEPAVLAVRPLAESKQLGLEVRVKPETTAWLDPQLTRSILQNLLDNAAKFTAQGRIVVSVDEGPHEVTVHVTDTCGGIAPRELRHIFEPFRRADQHADKPGSGLGLAIARTAVEAQGGAIDAESTPGRGCHFWFTLPREPQEQ
jgi:signal transduction histidine kinase